jgi:hypothetical protein
MIRSDPCRVKYYKCTHGIDRNGFKYRMLKGTSTLLWIHGCNGYICPFEQLFTHLSIFHPFTSTKFLKITNGVTSCQYCGLHYMVTLVVYGAHCGGALCKRTLYSCRVSLGPEFFFLTLVYQWFWRYVTFYKKNMKSSEIFYLSKSLQ